MSDSTQTPRVGVVYRHIPTGKAWLVVTVTHNAVTAQKWGVDFCETWPRDQFARDFVSQDTPRPEGGLEDRYANYVESTRALGLWTVKSFDEWLAS